MSEPILTPPQRSPLLPVLPLRDIVVFPHMIVPLFVGRKKSVNALGGIDKNKRILLTAQKKPTTDNPGAGDIYLVGVEARILQLLKLPDDTVKLLVEGTRRAKIKSITSRREYMEAEYEIAEEISTDNAEPLARAAASQFEEFAKINRKIPQEVLSSILQVDGAGKIADILTGHLPLKIAEKQELLEVFDVSKRLELLYSLIEREIDLVKVERRLRSRVRRQMDKTQREYYLNEQMKAIQQELGDGENGKGELAQIEAKAKKTRFSKEAREKITSEMKKLRQMSPSSAEANVVRNYIDWLISIPWNKRTRNRTDLRQAEKILNDEHYALEKVKERILEYLAVQTRTKKVRATILCLVGPPGVGKTSLGRSIAKATGRNFVRVSLGGVRDESEIRGHRRTYIGSMPGKIIQGIKKAKSSNPLFLLDEIDKLGIDWRGDPANALLEVLDPEQNIHFNDHYLEVDYDLSDVMFVTTANTLKMVPPLLDRLEILRIPGYTEDEKVKIAQLHLIPRQIERHGLKKGEFAISEQAVMDIIRYYTREAGVRNLEREIASLARKVVRKVVSGASNGVGITHANLGKLAGVRRFRYSEIGEKNEVGVTTGLAWTEFGGELLSVEAVVMPGKGKAQYTGKLGDVMKESVQAAVSFLRSRADSLGISKRLFEKNDIHLHVPEGATPKDGPSAGIAMCVSILSALTGIPTHKDLAMTGEITLSGRVLPVGGIREKLLAALRGGVRKVIIPEENRKDLEEIPTKVKKGLEIIIIRNTDEIWPLAMTSMPLPNLKEKAKGEAPTKVPHLEEELPKPLVKH